uniref:Uncharacterized protein n=1 Tax=Pan troglodytes TaxID=9598 RepID=A0A2I3RUT1_PANTR
MKRCGRLWHHLWMLPCLSTAASHPGQAISLQTKSWKESCFESLFSQLHVYYDTFSPKETFKSMGTISNRKSTVPAFDWVPILSTNESSGARMPGFKLQHSLTSCMILAKSLHLPEPQFPSL